MLAAAFIANEEVGAIHLEIHDRKYFLGLLTTRDLWVVPRGYEIEWPYPSLEAKVLRNLDRLSRQRKNSVSSIVYEWMDEDSDKPWESASRYVKEQLVIRGIMRKRVEPRFLRSNIYHFSIPTENRDVVSQSPISLITGMISDFKRTQPELSQRLFEEASKGVTRRQKQTHYDPY
jgi:hypothetical protein